MKKILKSLITLFYNLSKKLMRAYDLTYGCEELAHVFRLEVNERLSKNKNEYISNEMENIAQEALRENNHVPSPCKAFDIAVERFNEAKLNGELDCLYRRKENINED